MKINFSQVFNSMAAIAASCLLLCCNPARHLPEGEYLLSKNIVIDKYAKVDKSDIESYIKQKPNRKMILFKTYLRIYNSVDAEKLERIKKKRMAKRESHNSKRIEKYNRINAKREAKGKKPIIVNLKKKEPRPLREWWKSNGEPPVIYDSLLAKKSSKQIKLFLNNKGFFNSTVKDSASLPFHKKIKTYYIIKEGIPYTIRNLMYEIKDEQLAYYVLSDASGSFIQRGINYDVDVLQKERDRITNILRNDGYFYFSKEYIYYEVDSALGTREVDITIGIKNPVMKVTRENEKDTTKEISHSRYYLNNIYIYTDYDPQIKTPPKDSLLVNDYYLLSNGYLRYKPRLITDAMFISKGELYQQKHADQTYTRLAELRMFRSVQIVFSAISSDKLDCHIYLSNIPKQSLSAETEGTNTSGTLGIAGDIVYQNKNVFKGGEIFEWKLKGALEVQKTKEKEKNQIPGLESSPIPFNTLELGTEARLVVPNFQTPFHIKGTKNNNAKTNLIGSYNFQRRFGDFGFGRSIGNLSYGYSWKETATKQHIINPIEFNLINIFRPTDKLDSMIRFSKDPFLKNSYSDHFTLATHYVFIYNNQNINKKKNFSFFRFGAEGAGNTMRGIFRLIDQNRDINNKLDHVFDTVYYKDGYSIERSYTIEQIRFSQYVRFDFDYRFYKLINNNDKLVYRIAAGLGKPFANLRALPLEKSFFSGGPNSLRAWQSRTLGPGGFTDASPSSAADKIGDVKIETNIEYRFNVVKMLNAAMFIDAGNIWLRKTYTNTNYPNGEFKLKKTDSTTAFIGEMAIGIGMGIRFDFNFFIIRLDGAIKLKDPARKPNDRWMFGKYDPPVFNFGIGYPF